MTVISQYHACGGQSSGGRGVGKHRIICEIQDEKLTVLVLAVAHRKEVYR
jgi:mRNA-degrading endonuclease RelE of RelBE toxin-antitoxin system